MTWSVNIQNNSGRTVIAPAASVQYSEGQAACIAVAGLGHIRLLDVGHVTGQSHYWGVQVTSGAYQAIWSYDGGGLCTLTLNADGTFTLAGQGQSLTGKIGGAAPAVTYLPAGTKVYALGLTNAAWTQRVTLTLDGGRTSFWQGTGEGNTEIVDTSFMTPGGSGGQVATAILFDYSPDGGRTWNAPRVSPVGNSSIMGYNQRTIVAEDSADNDWNDCALILSWWMAPPRA